MARRCAAAETWLTPLALRGARGPDGLHFALGTCSRFLRLALSMIITSLPTIQFSGLIVPRSSLEGAAALMGMLFPAGYFLDVAVGTFTKALDLRQLWPQCLALFGFFLGFTGLSLFAHILRLGIKELTSLRHDSVLLLFLFYAFTVAIYMPAAGSVIGVHNASVAFVDEDHGQLSRQLAEALQPPEFQPAVPLAYDQLDKVMDSGQYTFVINVPANFQADLLAGRQPSVQVNVDATAMSQAFMGAGYIGRIFQ
eukprot:gene42320-52475_t